MTIEEFAACSVEEMSHHGWSAPLEALWWDSKGDWGRAHALVDDLETLEAMAVHAYLHRKEGAISNSEYWYARSGTDFRQPTTELEWETLARFLLSRGDA